MGTSQVQGGATNAVPEWTEKQGLPRILTRSRRCYELLAGQLIRHRLIIIDTQVRTALDCCKDFRNLLTSKLNEIKEKESILFQRFLLQQ